MAKYTKLVQNQTELIALKASADFITPNVTLVYDNRTIDFNPYVPHDLPHDYSQDYFTIEALESGTLNIEITPYNSENTKGYLQYSLDGGETWSEQYGSIVDLSLNANDKILLKGDITGDIGQSSCNSMSYTGNFNVCGNIMSLVYGDNFANQTSLEDKGDIFAWLFGNEETLLSAENLILPATTLDYGCYQCMFNGCTSLTAAPELPATTLAGECYNQMFWGCTNLNKITCLATDISAYNCTWNWVNLVSATGTFIKAASMTDWTTGNNGIPSGWTIQNAQ